MRHERPARLSLAAYVRRRTGRPLGAAGSLRAMLGRAFGATTLAGFWRHWNPIFGYALSRFVYTPSRRWLSHGPALIITFIVCGALHDVVTALARRDAALLFTPWFAAIAATILLFDRRGLSLRTLSVPLRALVHLTVLGATFWIAWMTNLLVIGG